MRIALVSLLLWAALTAGPYAGERVLVLPLSEAITPLTAGKVARALAEAEGAQALVITLDTPGGLVTSMREIVKDILGSKVPVVVFVHPPGARAASAGTFLVLAAHVAAMAPGTNLGAAHPVTMGRKMDEDSARKAENDLAALARSLASLRGRNADWAERAVRESVYADAREALRLGVVDLLARDLDELLRRLDGRRVRVGEREVVLATAGAEVVRLREGPRERVLRFLADPNVAYILLMLGLAGLYFELAHPGAVLPGVVGAVCLVLALYAAHLLPVSYAGLLLVLLSGLFFFLEVKIASYGLLGLAGLVSLALGSLMLFGQGPEGLRLSPRVLLPVLATVGSFLCLVTYLAARAVRRRPATGPEALLGAEGEARTRVSPRGGQVFLHGEIWQAVSREEIPVGARVRVVAVRGLRLEVERAQSTNWTQP